MTQRIRTSLRRIAANEDVRVLYAVESGSRGWGFASADSDWDVRFIYLRPREWYLSIQPRRDVLELPVRDGLDITGWDLKKALGLFARSNPPLLEWLRSPIVYWEDYSTTRVLRELSEKYFSPRSCMNHYLHMAEGNYREYLRGDTVRLKKYFYVLRPVLACRWIQAHGTMPPMEFADLVADQLPSPLRPAVDDLLRRKRAGDELGSGPRIPDINDFLEVELACVREWVSTVPRRPKPDLERLDRLFRDSLDEVWGRPSGGIHKSSA